MTTFKGLLGVTAVLALAGAANAALTITGLGTASPIGNPATAGMTAFGPDPTPVFTDVTSVAAPTGGQITFDIPMSHRTIGFGWATWSHGYTGDVYYTNGATSVNIGMPAGTVAFYLYAEPNPFGVFTISVTGADSGGATQTASAGVEGSAGAQGWVIKATAATITSINVTGDVDFAVGEFGIAVPAPGALALLGLAGLARSRRRA